MLPVAFNRGALLFIIRVSDRISDLVDPRSSLQASSFTIRSNPAWCLVPHLPITLTSNSASLAPLRAAAVSISSCTQTIAPPLIRHMFGQLQWRSSRAVRIVFIVARVSALSAGMYGAGYFSGVNVCTVPLQPQQTRQPCIAHIVYHSRTTSTAPRRWRRRYSE